jgi:PRC-barrel domain protein
MHTALPANDVDLVGTEIVFGTMPIGHVLDVIRDPLSQRVRRLITTYGVTARRVAIPMEWVVRRTSTRVTLGVGARSLDDLAEHSSALHSRNS